MKDKIVTVTRHWTPAAEVELQRLFSARLNVEDQELTADQIVERCDGASVLCPTVTDWIDAELIGRLPNSVRLIACFGAGIERTDVDAARSQGIPVSNTPGAVTEETADLAFGLIIAACRRFSEAQEFIRHGDWDGFSINFMLGTRVHGQTLGIVGMGNIGTAVARRARGFGMRLLYHGRNRNLPAEEKTGAEFCPDLEALLAESDIVSLHCPMNDSTRHLVDEKELAHMKPTAVLVNTSRGPVVRESALVKALKGGQIAAAGLDVFEFEPKVSQELRDLENVVLLPHLGSATRATRDAMGFRVIDNIVSFLKTGKVLDELV
jgi:glyoxylate reductase